ncbi:MAG: TonB-dependent receptor [Flavobacteriales bacterium]
MKNFLLLAALLLFSQTYFAQNMKVSGRIVDSSGVAPIKEASIMAIHLRDSVLVRYTRSNSAGEFEMNNLPLDSFQLVIEHSNWTPRSIYLMGSAKKATFELPDIRLYPKVQDVKEVVVSRNRNAMYFSGDTLIFVADSFKVAENAVVEDLLKKLPGIKVEDDGSITSQGKEISQVLVDGDEFFGSDPTIATKNLAAKGVESVQVYEKKNEDAAAGEDDKIQVLDLKLKDEAKRGYFGKASAASDFNQGAADQAFYESELLFNKFDKTQKISVFMLASNTPKSSFGFGDMNKFGLDNERDESGLNFWDRDSRGNKSGIPQTLKTGVYYNDRLSEKVKLGVNYAYYDSRLQANSSSQTQYFLADSSYYTKDSANNQSLSSSHRFNMNLQIDIDSLTKLELKPNVHFDAGEQDNTTVNKFLDNSFAEYLTTNINNRYDSKGVSSNSEAILRRKFAKKDRELEAKYILRYNDNSSEGNLQTNTAAVLFDTIINQRKTNDNRSNTQYGTLTFTEPLSKNFILSTEYFIELGAANQARYTYNANPTGAFTQVDSLFTNDFVNDRLQQRGTMILTYLYKNHRVSGGLGYRNIQIENFNQFTNLGINQNISNFLPNFSYQFKPSMAKRINIRYSTYSAPPSANDLQPVRDNTNPNRIQEGNPDLKPNYQHQLNFNANVWQAMTGRYIWSGGNATFTQNAFGTNTTFDQFGRTISKTINVDGNMFATIYAGGGYPILNRKLTFEPSMNVSYFRNNNYINNLLNTTSTTTLNGAFAIEVSLDSLELNIGADYTYVNPVTTLSTFANQPYNTQNYFMIGDLRIPKHFRFKWELNYTLNRGRAAEFNRDLFIVDLELQKAFLKTENLIVGLSINDLLNQNINLQRTVNGNMITDNYTRIITRYFMLRVTYKFNNNKTREEDLRMWH